MTLKDLSQLYYLNREIKRDSKRLKELRLVELNITAKYSDMPRNKSKTNDIMAQKVATIVDLEEMLEINKVKRYYEEKKLMNFISAIDDCYLRLIFKLRFIDCRTWNNIAHLIGGGNTEDSVRKICMRYIKKLSGMSGCNFI